MNKITLIRLALAGITFAVFSWLINWKFALVMMATIGFHESGHLWAMRRFGLSTAGFFFLPLIGGVSIATKQAESYRDETIISLMGPIWGLVLATLTTIIYAISHNPFWLAVAFFMVLVNIFNLIPIGPIDGGRVMNAIFFSISPLVGLISKFVGIGLIIVLAILLKAPAMLLFLFLAQQELIDEHLRYLKLKVNLEMFPKEIVMADQKKSMTWPECVLSLILAVSIFFMLFALGNFVTSEPSLGKSVAELFSHASSQTKSNPVLINNLNFWINVIFYCLGSFTIAKIIVGLSDNSFKAKLYRQMAMSVFGPISLALESIIPQLETMAQEYEFDEFLLHAKGFISEKLANCEQDSLAWKLIELIDFALADEQEGPKLYERFKNNQNIIHEATSKIAEIAQN